MVVSGRDTDSDGDAHGELDGHCDSDRGGDRDGDNHGDRDSDSNSRSKSCSRSRSNCVACMVVSDSVIPSYPQDFVFSKNHLTRLRTTIVVKV